ncbi:hypothetical protein RMCBS344292_12093 [Rhizopus microsporus]|nr:hypothetical protein RMCBS344292_12093 [Rhizopus microsporus]
MAEKSPSTPTNISAAITTGSSFKRHYRPYYTKKQIATLNSVKKLGPLASKETTAGYSSCKFMQDVGRKLGFPQKTISTSQALYHRFYLYYSIKDYSPQDISVTCLFVASKIEETIKKLKDIFVAVHSVKYPDSKELDPEHIAEDRKRRIISYEKLVLETACFNFQLRHPYEYVIKFTKWLKDQDNTVEKLIKDRPWDQYFLSRMDDIEDVTQQILDLYIATNSRHDVGKYTKLKIMLNEQAQQRGPDPYLDEISKIELSSMASNSNIRKMAAALDEVNTNQHTVSYHFG